MQAVFAALLCLGVYGQAHVQLDPWADNSIRVRIAPSGTSIVDPPIRALLPLAPVSTVATVRSSAGTVTSLINGNLRVDADASAMTITATRLSDGFVLLEQTSLAFGPPVFNGTGAKGIVTAAFKGHAGERIYGLGEHRTGTVNQMPYYKKFQDSQYYPDSHGGDVSIPWYCSSLGYGFVWNSAAYGSVNISESAIVWTSYAGTQADFWITVNVSTDPTRSPFLDLMQQYVDAVGHAPPMPYYATGFIQCKDRYRNQSQLLEVAQGYVDRGLPIAVIVIDWMHWVAQGDWSFNPLCWPDPQGMTDELRTLGIEPMVTFWPFQSVESQHWTQFTRGKFLVPNLDGVVRSFDGPDQYLYDPTNPVARNVTFADFWEGYGQYGFKTVWLDAAEPERFNYPGFGNWSMQMGTDGEIGEAWVQQHVRTFAEGFASKGIGPSDYFVLPRHAWAGTWQHSAALWSGDIQSVFSELEIQVRVLQGVMMSGVVLWTTDIGGYWGGDPTDPTFQDLIVRWFQFGAFCPLFRLHGHRAGGPPANECGPTNGDNEVWNLAKDPTHYNGIVRVMRLRENLREYVSQINALTAQTGLPMVRPMFLEFPNDPATQGPAVEGQFMFGPDWLVSPVTTYQASSWSVYLPQLNSSWEWVYFFNETVYPSGQSVTLATPIDEFPLFYRRAVPPPPPPPVLGPATFMFSNQRMDQVLCISATCYADNLPDDAGNYYNVSTEGQAVVSAFGASIVVANRTYALVPLNLFFSFTREDNFVSTNATAPDNTYSISFGNGYALTSQAPGTLPLQIWFRKNSGVTWDYATVATAAGVNWLKQKGYTYVTQSGFIFA